MLQMYPGQVNSPTTELAEAIDDSQTSIEVVDSSILPDAPNLATIGAGENAETILYTEKTGDVLSGVTRGFQGTARTWSAGSKVSRVFTEYDYNALKENIETLKENVDTNADDIVNLQDDLDAHKADVATQINDLDAEKASRLALVNAKEKLNIVNYLGNTENIHPKVLYFSDKLFGWRYWMAYTPYPESATQYENPCLAVSNDGINWTTPSLSINPLDVKPEPAGYNSDTHLVYRTDTSTLEIWWRAVIMDAVGNLTKTQLLRRTTTDGTTWTVKEVMFDSSEYGYDYVSPTIIYDSGKYCLWGIYGRNIRYNESVDGKTWVFANERRLNIWWGYIVPWHLDVIKTDKGYEYVVQCYSATGGNNNNADLYYIQSNDNITFPNEPVLILQKSNDPSAMDNRGIYRSSVVMVGDMYYLYYSYVAQNAGRGIALTTGKDILALRGYKGNGVLEYVKPQLTDVNGVRLPKVQQTSSSVTDESSYIKASKSLPRTAQVTGEINKDMSAGLQVGRLYIDESSEVIEQSLSDVNGAIRRVGKSLQLYYNGWSFINDIRDTIELTADTVVTDLDLSLYHTVFIRGANVVINGVKNGEIAAITRIIIDATGASCTINDGNGIVTPSRSPIILNGDKVSCAIMRVASTRWRVF